MNILKAGLVCAVALTGAGCVSNDYGDKQLLGSLIGAGAGGLVGAQIGGGSGKLAATAAGTLLGALIGGAAGQSLDRADAAYAARAQHHALEHQPTGVPVTWRNPDSGHYGAVEPMGTYREPGGAYCREYQHTVFIGGREQQAYGHACRQPDGSWRVEG